MPWEIFTVVRNPDDSPTYAEYIEEYISPHQLSLVDLDYRDMRLEVFVDGISAGSTSDFASSNSVFCGVDVNKCLEGEFSHGTFTIPAGRHIVRIAVIGESKS